MTSGIPALDDSTLEKTCSPLTNLVYRHWSDKQQEGVEGINLITLCGGRMHTQF